MTTDDAACQPLDEAQLLALQVEYERELANKRLVQNNLNLTWNKAKLSIVESLLTRDFAYRTRFNEAFLNRDEYLAYVKVFRRSMPDLELTIEELMAEGNRVMSRVTFSGTVHQDFFGIPASDRVIAFEAISMWDIRFGKISSLETLLDMASIERQVSKDLPILEDLTLD